MSSSHLNCFHTHFSTLGLPYNPTKTSGIRLDIWWGPGSLSPPSPVTLVLHFFSTSPSISTVPMELSLTPRVGRNPEEYPSVPGIPPGTRRRDVINTRGVTGLGHFSVSCLTRLLFVPYHWSSVPTSVRTLWEVTFGPWDRGYSNRSKSFFLLDTWSDRRRDYTENRTDGLR